MAAFNKVVGKEPMSPVSPLLTGFNRKVSDEDLTDPGVVMANLYSQVVKGADPVEVLNRHKAKVSEKPWRAESLMQGPDHRVLVCGLPKTATESELSDFFGCCGHVVSVRMEIDDSNRNSQRAVIEFATLESVDVALSLHGAIVCGVSVDISQPPCGPAWPVTIAYGAGRAGSISKIDPSLAECLRPVANEPHDPLVVQPLPQRTVRFGCCTIS